MNRPTPSFLHTRQKETTMTINITLSRRRVLKTAAAAVALTAAHGGVLAQSKVKMRIGYWPVASGIPFFAAVEKGYFREAGLDVEAVKFASPQQVVEAMLAGRIDGSANGTASGALGIGEQAQPGLLKIFCTNPTNKEFVLDEVLVAKDAPYQRVADLAGKRVATGPGVQNVVIAKTILQRAGATGATVVELPIGQHVAAIAAGQVDGAYTLEPTGTVGRLNGTTRAVEVGVVARYILGDEMAPWHGGAASLSTEFLRKHPDVAKTYMDAYRRGVQLVKQKSDEARPFLKGYTAIEGPLTSEVPMADYMFYDEFTPEAVGHFQKFYDLFTEHGVYQKRLDVAGMLYRP